mmetsp:Transcript_26730/g.32416  ORF Transcript_26730/g.32416 Transcript_26730/m.32416 type:complete len:110 (-) Transcript_26730:1146-1475(-)
MLTRMKQKFVKQYNPPKKRKETCFCPLQEAITQHDERRPYMPRKSKRVPSRKYVPHDGDTWTEKIVYHEKLGRMRSYFKSEMTGRCVWDEPPSGASRVVLARKKTRNAR